MLSRRLPSFFALALALACDPAAVTEDAGVDASVDAGPSPCADALGDPTAVFALPRGEAVPGAFFDLPWPNDIRRTAAGSIDVSAFPNPRRNAFISRYLEAMSARLDGYATNGSIYFRASHAIDETTLSDATVLLVDVDAASPATGEFHPIELHYQECPTQYWGAHTIALRPVYGIPLASARRYAAVLTRGVRTAGGAELTRDADFEDLVSGGGDATVAGARATYGDVFDVLATAGVSTDDLLAVAVFTTQDAIGETIAIRDWMVDSYPEPTLVPGSVRVSALTGRMTVLEGRYGPSPIFQDGEIPYTSDGGAIRMDPSSGEPVVAGTFDAHFVLTVPTTPMPPEGYPIVLYAHGTGGDSRTVVSNDTATLLAERGIAAMGVDQIHHGERNPTATDPALLFFNISNPNAARDNNRQSALDVVQQRRVVPNLDFDTAFVERDGLRVRFDPTRIIFMGHSQGGLNGPIFLGIDDGVLGGVLSAASAVITPALIEKLEPLVIPSVVVTVLDLPGASWQEAFALEGFTYEHPIPTLLQTWVEASDTSNYAHLIFAEPRPGAAPKSVLMTEGLMDVFSPPVSIEALAGAVRLPQINPVHNPVAGLVIRGVSPQSAPATGNVAGGLATAGLLQFPDDGHFAVFDNDVASRQVFDFLGSLAGDGPVTIPAP